MGLDDTLREDATQLAGDLTDLRHRLHRQPEIGLDLPQTQQTLLRELDGLGLEITLGRVAELDHCGAARRRSRRRDGAAAR